MIEFANVSKDYRSLVPPRTTQALCDLTLSIERGEVFGIAGPNGAGKTTMLGLVLGFLGPSQGTVRVSGESPRRHAERFGVAYLSELIAVPTWWTVTGALRRYSVLAGVPERERAARVGEAIERLGLEEHRSKRIKQLSKGNLQRLGLTQALLADNDLVVLDEPTHGLDPLWTQRFRDIVLDLKRADRAIVIASHNLDELERLADRVAILDRGRLSRIVGAHHVESGQIVSYRLVPDGAPDGLVTAFPDAAPVDGSNPPMYEVRGDLSDLNASLARYLAQGGRVRAFFPARSRLEEAFRDAVGQG